MSIKEEFIDSKKFHLMRRKAQKFGMRTDTFIKLDLILGIYNFSYF